jgi:aspartate aminotransferase
MLNSPSNPSGAVYSRAELEALGAVLQRHPQVWIMSDDIYEKIRYDETPFATMACGGARARRRARSPSTASRRRSR